MPRLTASLLLIFVSLSALNFNQSIWWVDPVPQSTRPPRSLPRGERCPPLSDPSGPVVTVSSESELQAAVANLNSGTTILIDDGVYDLTHTLVIRGGVVDVAIRSASGDREAVILRGRGMTNASYANVPHGFLIQDADDILIANLTVRDFYFHAIQIQGEQGPQRPFLYNLHLLDSGEQLIKGSTAGPPGPYSDGGVVACSTIEYADRAPSWYTNGVDVLAGADWIIRDNVFRNIRAPAGELAGPAVLMWRNSLNTVVERNQFIECDRAIALGLSTPDGNSRDGEATYDHQGGVVRNNMIARVGVGDVGISINYARDVQIYHNTVLLNGTFPWGAIEYRFPVTSAEIRYNLTDAPIWQRDGAEGNVVGNLTTAQMGWFVAPAAGDLHLTASAGPAIDQATPLIFVVDDFDGDPRPIGLASDLGADEFGAYPPEGVIDLRVQDAITGTGALTVTLAWTPPAIALTTTVRYASSVIDESSWAAADPLGESMPRDGGLMTAMLPYAGGNLYFALKTQDLNGSWSSLSNNAFWPAWQTFLPTINR